MIRTTCFALAMMAGSLAHASTIYTQAFPTGILPDTAQNISFSGPLDILAGQIDPVANPIELFRFQIPDPAAFSAQTIVGDLFFAPVATPILYLFDDVGNPIYADSDSGGSRQGYLGAGLPIGPAASGFYLLAITWFGNVPVDHLGNPLFQDFQTPYLDGQFISYAPNTGVGPLSAWQLTGGFFEDGPDYQINLTGVVATPEPGTLGLLASALAMLATISGRRYKKRW
ncbi:MAG TPA: PEP-CTERM sorting domain-containing protein [Bryobacteraceae bacterium]|nr:PEP-CTERM sorting domain-containing protein [Bryobacteraceae bacterium]